ncbi:glucuronate isomerase [Marinovum sp. 2_MG-2023]|uniref:glucuronate isomerase n=1 Tax=unclassified Marinovum TaxID=2647166 RepID=UPI0026E4801B|nr:MULTISPECIES: glucuronate isomerase [unclassified Marinovum]MDO6731252.1 glucuronate isomerase [Marinovum sp. 2_MG-2023]MDO6780596.1 glucuronate isomerase [Marinovum sp. 1_MG-2023]
MTLTDPDRLFPIEPRLRDMARAMYQSVCDLPILSPHGHCDPSWFAENARFPNPAELFVIPDHYVFRMLVSQGVTLAELGVPRVDGGPVESDPRAIWRRFAERYHLFRGTPSAMWLEHSFEHVFGLNTVLSADTADACYDHIEAKLATDAFRPRALFESFNLELLATTEGALDDLRHHAAIRDSGWQGRVVTTYRPDAVVDPEFEGFADNLVQLGALTGEDTATWAGYLAAHRTRRAFFKSFGATASDHGHPTARTADLPQDQAAALYDKVRSGDFTADEADLFRGQMLTEMARMSLDDGLTLQIHPGSRRNHSANVFATFGRDKGFDIPGRTDYVAALKPLLDAVGMEPDLTIILFTLDETAYGRELAPLAGVYPALRLGPPWWFFDSYEGIRRFRETTTETCGFYNTAGFNDDTRAFCSIPARHDVARRSDCAYLAQLVATGRLREADAYEVAHDLTYGLAKAAYKL